MKLSNGKGFSLVEILVIVIVAGILLGLAVPSYQGYIQRSDRTDATVALQQISGSQERFYLQQGRYASNAELGAVGFPAAKTERGLYRLSIAPHRSGLSVGYTARAVAVATAKQSADSNCRTFSINELGHRGVNDGYNPTVVEECWH